MTEPTKPDAPPESSRESEDTRVSINEVRRMGIEMRETSGALHFHIASAPTVSSFLDSEEADEYRQAVEEISRRLSEASAEQSSLSPQSTVNKPEMDFSALAQQASKAPLDSFPKQHPLYAFGAGCVMSVVALILTITASTTVNPNDISARFTAYFLAGLTGSASALAFSNSYSKKPTRNS